jgi:transcriptional regulator with XRE-family HTH domain
MDIGERLRGIREEKNLSQGDMEERSGLLRCYISRVENGHTVPSLETLEKMARALGMPLYELMYDGPEGPASNGDATHSDGWGSSGKDVRFMNRLRQSLAKMTESDRALLLSFAEKISEGKKRDRNDEEVRLKKKRDRTESIMPATLRT